MREVHFWPSPGWTPVPGEYTKPINMNRDDSTTHTLKESLTELMRWPPTLLYFLCLFAVISPLPIDKSPTNATTESTPKHGYEVHHLGHGSLWAWNREIRPRMLLQTSTMLLSRVICRGILPRDPRQGYPGPTPVFQILMQGNPFDKIY